MKKTPRTPVTPRKTLTTTRNRRTVPKLSRDALKSLRLNDQPDPKARKQIHVGSTLFIVSKLLEQFAERIVSEAVASQRGRAPTKKGRVG
jgi:hypothetical protein